MAAFLLQREAKLTGQKVGRPSSYTPAIKDEIVSLMASGLSLTAAAADLGVHRDTVYAWANQHPDFSDALKLAKAKRQLFLERRLLSADSGPVVTSSIFALKNAAPDDWRDRVHTEVSGPNGGPIQTADLSKLSDDQLTHLASILAAARSG